jgi:hypothetical protein
LNTGSGDDVVQINAGSVVCFDFEEDFKQYGLNMGEGNDTLVLNGSIVLDYNPYYGEPKSKDWFAGIENISGKGTIYVEMGTPYKDYINYHALKQFETAGIKICEVPNSWAYLSNGTAENGNDTIQNAEVIKYDEELNVWLCDFGTVKDTVDWYQLNIGGNSGITTKDIIGIDNGDALAYDAMKLEVCDKNGNVIKTVDGSIFNEYNGYCAPVLNLSELGNGTYYLKFSIAKGACGASEFVVCSKAEWND